MTQEEQIQRASEEFAQNTFSIRPELVADSFSAGAKWTIDNLLNPTIEKLEIEYFERFKEARQEDKEKLITEVCEYLEENIDEDLVIFNNRTWTSRDNLIKDLRKTLEDLK